MATNFGKILEEKRKKIGITQEDLARKVKIERTYMSKLESSKSNPAFSTIEKLCNGLGITIAEFFSGIEQKEPKIIEFYEDKMIKRKIKQYRVKAEMIPIKVIRDLSAFSRKRDIRKELSTKYVYIEKSMFKDTKNIFGVEIDHEYTFLQQPFQNPIFLIDTTKRKIKYGDYYIVEPKDRDGVEVTIQQVDLVDSHVLFFHPAGALVKPSLKLIYHKYDFDSDVIRGKVVGIISRL